MNKNTSSAFTWNKTDLGYYTLPMKGIDTFRLAGAAICDWCNGFDIEAPGQYIAVLSHWYCQSCFEQWYNNATYYPDDIEVEHTNVRFISQILKIDPPVL